MHIALCCKQDTEPIKRALSAFGKVTVFAGAWDRSPAVQLAYYLEQGEPCELVVVALDGAAGMHDCKQIKSLQKDLPILWITEQEAFWKESQRLGVEEFLVKPVPEGMLKKVVEHLLEREKSHRQAESSNII